MKVATVLPQLIDDIASLKDTRDAFSVEMRSLNSGAPSSDSPDPFDGSKSITSDEALQ